jgi:hypothetical protein
MDATTVAHALRGFASQRAKTEEIEFVAELLLAVREDNVTLTATALAPLLVESFDGVEWVDAARLREISEALARVLTGEESESSGEDGGSGGLSERMLAALKNEYALDKSCLALLAEDDEWHPARIRRHVDESALSTEKEIVDLRLEVEFLEFGKLQVVPLEDVVLDEDVAEEDGDADKHTRCCEMCGREMRLTFHHLTPRDMHAKYLKKGYTREFLNLGVMICRPCHSKIHSSEDNKTLAREYNTLDKIMGHPDIVRFVNYVRKQRTTARPEKKSRWPVGK